MLYSVISILLDVLFLTPLNIVIHFNLTSSGPMGIGSNPNEYIQDETLAHLTVKELNKRVSNLSRDEVVALKQRRRTLKNRG